ncbi:MAG: hypothetical protein IPG95_05445 [Saprospiraceae bacterium]|nr:hypothetical protein [Saprospiraceae bacterium]
MKFQLQGSDLLANYHFNQELPDPIMLASQRSMTMRVGRNGSLSGFALNGSTLIGFAPGSPAAGISCGPVHNLTQNTYFMPYSPQSMQQMQTMYYSVQIKAMLRNLQLISPLP